VKPKVTRQLPHRHRPAASLIAFERMQAQPWQRDVMKAVSREG
jgi:hypothetical protein